MLYWYMPWILDHVKYDRGRLYDNEDYDSDEDSDDDDENRNKSTEETTPVPIDLSVFEDLYFDEDTAYNSIPMGPNPNNSSTFITISSQYLNIVSIFLIVLYKTNFM